LVANQARALSSWRWLLVAKKIAQKFFIYFNHLIGGAKGSRTPDLLNAIQALSQLSYGPNPVIRARGPFI
jgi:hypothetical protein